MNSAMLSVIWPEDDAAKATWLRHGDKMGRVL